MVTVTNVVLVLVIVIGVAILGAALYVYLRDKSLSEIRADVYQLFLEAEHSFKESGSGKQKMKWVVSKARMLLPGWAQTLITEDFLYKVLESWFRAVKDLLDDGKYNGSVSETPAGAPDEKTEE